MTEPNAGDVSVRVTPDARDFASSLRRQVVPDSARIGDEAGEAMSERLRREIARGITEGFEKSDPTRKGSAAGDKYGGAFGQSVRKQLTAALKNLPDAEIDADTSEAELKLRSIREDLAHLSDGHLGVDLSDDEALAKIKRLRLELDELALKSPDIRVKVDSASASADLKRLESDFAALANVTDGFEKSDPTRKGSAAGDKYGGAFGQSVRKQLTAALKNLPDAEIDADTSEAELKLRSIREDLAHLSDGHLGVDLSDDEALAKIKRLRLELDELALKSPDIRVKVDSASASADLKRLESDFAALANVTDGFGKSIGADSSGGPSKLMLALGAGATLAGPAVAATSAAVLGLAAAAGVGVLAIKGLQDQEKQGTQIGNELKGSLSSIGSEVQRLQAIAAVRASGGILDGLDKLHESLPSLEPIVSSLAEHLGNAFDISTEGLITGLKNASPLIDLIGRGAESLAHDFADFTASEDFKHFIAYAEAELPKVAKTLGDVGGAVIDVGKALAPAGDALITNIDNIAKAIDALHIDKLAMLVDLAGKVTSGAAITSVVDNVSGKNNSSLDQIIEKAQKQADAASATQAEATARKKFDEAATLSQTNALQAQADVYGTTIPLYNQATAAIAANTDSLQLQELELKLAGDSAGLYALRLDELNGKALSAAQAQNGFEQSLLSSTDRARAAQDALASAENQVSSAARGLASAQDGVTKASLQSDEAQRKLTATHDAEKRAIDGVAAATKKLASDQAAAQKLATAANAADQVAKTAAGRLAAVKADRGATPGELKAAQAAATKAAADAAKADKAAVAAAAKAKADQAALVRSQTALTNSKRAVATAEDGVTKAALASEAAQRSLESAQQASSQAADALTKAQDAASRSLRGLSDAAVANRGDLLSQASSAEALSKAIANIDGGNAGRAALIRFRDQIIENAVKTGENRAEVQALIDEILKVPPLDIDSAKAETKLKRFASALAAIAKSLGKPLDADQLNQAVSSLGHAEHLDAIGKREGGILDYFARGGVNDNGRIMKFANGSENHVAQIAPAGAWRVWAEPETEGEGYIPLAPSKRARSEMILGEIAHRFGKRVVPYADGALVVRDGGSRGGVTVQQTINNPIPEVASVSGPDGMRRAAYALGDR